MTNDNDLIPRDAAIGAIERWWMCSQTTWQSPMTLLRAIPTIDPAAIREAALREAALRIGGMIRGYDKTEYEEGYNDALATAESYILTLIGEKK